MQRSHPQRARLLAATLVTCLCAQAFAQPGGTAPAPAAAPAPEPAAERAKIVPVAIALTDNAQAQAAQIGYILESAVRRSNRHEFVDPVEKFDPVGVENRKQKQQRAMDALAFGRKAYENLEEGMGLESFDRAIASFEESALWENFHGLTQALAMRILVKWAEDPAATRKEIQRLMAVDPRVEFPPELTPPDLAQELQRAKDARSQEQKSALDVSSEPVAARVYVDGAYRGTTPTSVRGLPSGEHYLSLVAPGYAVVQTKVRAGPGATTTVSLKPAERAKPFLTFLERIKKGFGGADEVTAARVLARVCEADEVLIAGVSRQAGRLKVEFHRIALKDGHVPAMGDIELGESDPTFPVKVDQEASKNLATDRPRGSKGEPVGLKSEIAEIVSRISSIDQDKVKLGIGIGGGVLFGTGLVLGLVAHSKASDYRAMVQTDPLLAERASSGTHTAIAADVFMTLGLAAGGTWAWMEFGKRFQKKSDLETPPVLEQKKEEMPEEKKPQKKKPEEDDPFADAAPVEPAAGLRSLVALPLSGGAFLGVQGAF